MIGSLYVSYIGDKYKISNVNYGGHLITNGSLDVEEDLDNIKSWFEYENPCIVCELGIDGDERFLTCDRDINVVLFKEIGCNPMTFSSNTMTIKQIRGMYNASANVNIIITETNA